MTKLSTYLVPLAITYLPDARILPTRNKLAVYLDEVCDARLITTTGPNGFNARIIVNQRQGLSFLFFGPERQDMHLLVIPAFSDRYRTWIKLRDRIDVYVKSVAVFKFDFPF